MTVKSVEKDLAAKTMTVVAEFDAAIERVWELWNDPRKLERWWGPPTYPATVHQHDFRAGGRVTYAMTGPEGDTHGGWWRVVSVDAPRSFEVEDGFGDETGNPNLEMPTMMMRVDLVEFAPGRTRAVVVSTFASQEAMQQVIEMGVEEGMRAAMGQMDGVLATA